MRKPHLLDRVREAIRVRHYSLRTEEVYLQWVRRYILFHGKRHPDDMGEAEVAAFLSYLAMERNVAAATQNQALSAILFLYTNVLGRDLDWLKDVARAKRPRRLPVVLSRDEIQRVLARMVGINSLLARLMYGCAFTVVPKSLNADTKSGEAKPLHPLWSRRMTTKFNGVSYLVQRAAEALYSVEGKVQVKALIEHYLANADVLRTGAKKAGLKVFGGVNAPYIWVRTPKGVTSWQAFDKILIDTNVVITPGSGFGSKGEGYFRISAFNSRTNAGEVARRLPELKW